MTWLRNLWRQWIAAPEPEEPDDDYLATGPVDPNMPVPGEDTHKFMTNQFPPPSAWDRLGAKLQKESTERRAKSERQK